MYKRPNGTMSGSLLPASVLTRRQTHSLRPDEDLARIPGNSKPRFSILEEHSLSDSVFMIRGESADELDFDGTLGFDGAPGSDGPVLTRSADSYNTASSAAAFTELCDLYDSVLESYSDFRSPVGN